MNHRAICSILAFLLLSISFLPGCLDNKRDDAQGGFIVPDTTKQVKGDLIDSIISISEDASRIVLDGTKTSWIERGDVLSFGISDRTPHGLLRKVNDVERSGSRTTLITEQATIEDAVEKGRVELNQTLSGPLKTLDALPGVMIQNEKTRSGEGGILFEDVMLYEGSQGGKVLLNGYLDMDFELIFVLELDSFSITECSFGTRTAFQGELDVISDGDANLMVELEAARFEFPPIIIPMGSIELIIVPVLSLVLGSEGTVRSGLSFNAEQNTFLESLVHHPDWEPVKDFTSNFGYSSPVMPEASNLRCYFGPEMSLMLWGMVGPYITAHGYMKAETAPDGSWWLYSGLSFGMGFKIEVIGETIKEWEDSQIINIRRLVATNMDDLSDGWVIEKLDHSVQITDPVMAAMPDGGLAIAYHSIDPQTYDFPFRLAVLRDGTWSYEDLVRTCDHDMTDMKVGPDGRVIFAYYEHGFDPFIGLVEWDGRIERFELRDPDNAGRKVTELEIVTDDKGRTGLYYVLSEDKGSGPFYKFTEGILKRALYSDGDWLIDTMIKEDDVALTGLDATMGSDASVHLTYFRYRMDVFDQKLVHSIYRNGKWTNRTVFKEDAVWNDPGRTELRINNRGDPSVLFDDNNGTLHFYRFENGQWRRNEPPGVKGTASGHFSLHLIGTITPCLGYIDTMSGNRTLHFSRLSWEGWDTVDPFAWSDWRFPGGTDIDEAEGSVMVVFNDGLYIRVARRSFRTI